MSLAIGAALGIMSVKGVPFGYWLLANAALTFPLPVREFQALLWHTVLKKMIETYSWMDLGCLYVSQMYPLNHFRICLSNKYY